MSKIDVTMHSDEELSLLVFNDECLYDDRHTRYFLEIIKDNYIYTETQLEVLENDLKEDLLEEA